MFVFFLCTKDNNFVAEKKGCDFSYFISISHSPSFDFLSTNQGTQRNREMY